MEEALDMAQSYIGRRPTVSLLHFPPILMTDVSGTAENVHSQTAEPEMARR
jgi:hypothetical protein